MSTVPCPFCGKVGTHLGGRVMGPNPFAGGPNVYHLQCNRCGATGPVVPRFSFDSGRDCEEAAEVAWKERTGPGRFTWDRFKTEAVIATLRTATRLLERLRFPKRGDDD